MRILANSEDPDEIPHNATFHQGRRPHSLLIQKRSFVKEVQFFLQIIDYDPPLSIMDHPKLIVSNQREEPITNAVHKGYCKAKTVQPGPFSILISEVRWVLSVHLTTSFDETWRLDRIDCASDIMLGNDETGDMIHIRGSTPGRRQSKTL